MKILICDADESFVAKIKNIASDIFEQNGIVSNFAVCNDSREFFASSVVADIAFVSEEMPCRNGLEIAKRLMELNPETIIFMFTSAESYLDEALDLSVFRYFKKSVEEERLRRGIEKALEKIDCGKITFSVKRKRNAKTIAFKDIIYVEIVGRMTRVITIDGEYFSKNTMSFWSDRLISKSFVKVHKSFIVNMDYVTDYSSRATILLAEKYTVPIAYREQTNFKRRYFEFKQKK